MSATKQEGKKRGLAPDGSVYSCYEAGRDGFWIHRCLIGVGVMVVGSAGMQAGGANCSSAALSAEGEPLHHPSGGRAPELQTALQARETPPSGFGGDREIPVSPTDADETFAQLAASGDLRGPSLRLPFTEKPPLRRQGGTG